jgi:hypothetical protein
MRHVRRRRLRLTLPSSMNISSRIIQEIVVLSFKPEVDVDEEHTS